MVSRMSKVFFFFLFTLRPMNTTKISFGQEATPTLEAYLEHNQGDDLLDISGHINYSPTNQMHTMFTSGLHLISLQLITFLLLSDWIVWLSYNLGLISAFLWFYHKEYPSWNDVENLITSVNQESIDHSEHSFSQVNSLYVWCYLPLIRLIFHR